MCVSKNKEIHAQVTEFRSGNKMQTSGRTDIRGNANTPPLCWAGDKNEWSLGTCTTGTMQYFEYCVYRISGFEVITVSWFQFDEKILRWPP